MHLYCTALLAGPFSELSISQARPRVTVFNFAPPCRRMPRSILIAGACGIGVFIMFVGWKGMVSWQAGVR